MKRPHRESPSGTHFVGFSPLSRYYEDAKWRHRFNRAKQQHAVDQMVFGSTLLHPPGDRDQVDYYRRNDVFCTSTGEYFTTLKPVPLALASHVIGTKPTREELRATEKT